MSGRPANAIATAAGIDAIEVSSALIGTHGVGKTTLCFELAARLKRQDVDVEMGVENGRLMAYLAAHDEWLGGRHEYTVLHVAPAVPPRPSLMV